MFINKFLCVFSLVDQTFLLLTNQNPSFAFFKSSDRVRSINTPDVANADISIQSGSGQGGKISRKENTKPSSLAN